MKENTFKKWFIPEMKLRGYPFVRKYLPNGNSGTVDLIAVLEGLLFGIELKQSKDFQQLESDKKGLRKLQKVERSEIVFSGAVHMALGLTKKNEILLHTVWDFGRKERFDTFKKKQDFLYFLIQYARTFYPASR